MSMEACNMRSRLRILGLVAAASLALPAMAVDKVLLETPVTYDPNAGVARPVREQCDIEGLLAKRVGAALAKRARMADATVAAGAAAAGTPVLRLTITHVLGVGGGAWSGPKAITLRAELLDGKTVTRQQKVNRWSMGGFWGGFKGTCSILDRTATRLAKDLTQWSYDPRFKMDEDEAPPKADEPAAQAQGEPEGEKKE